MTQTEPDGYLTQAQRLIWAGQQLHPDVPLYNMVLAFRFDGAIDVEAFSAAFQALVVNTDALRTVFGNRDGVPHRMVRDDIRPTSSTRISRTLPARGNAVESDRRPGDRAVRSDRQAVPVWSREAW